MSATKEQYTLGYGAASTEMMINRTAESHLGFLLPHLKPGMRILDCGCGPGSLTLSLAETANPEQIIGTDLEESQLEIARSEAVRRNIDNASFEIASIYDLPFESNSFDIVVISAVIGNLQEPLRGFNEVHRILKTGGIIAVKEFDHGGDLFYPTDTDFLNSLKLYHRLRRHNGHDPESGRKVFAYLQKAGFRNCIAGATYKTFCGPDVLTGVGKLFAELINEAFATPSIEMGWVTPDEVERMKAAWEEFPSKPGAFYAQTWCEILGWK